MTSLGYTVKPLLREHVKQDIFWLLKRVVTYCCMVIYCCIKVAQKAHELLALLSFGNKKLFVYSDFHVI